jgi:nitrate/TMAO reductase-like tetraheme cytochrome c subunit
MRAKTLITNKEGNLYEQKKVVYKLDSATALETPVILALGVFVGSRLMIIRISNAASYLSNDPDACIKCHVMTTQYATCQRSSHARVQLCCLHVPQDNF